MIERVSIEESTFRATAKEDSSDAAINSSPLKSIEIRRKKFIARNVGGSEKEATKNGDACDNFSIGRKSILPIQ